MENTNNQVKFWIIFLIASLGQIASDIYLPSLPHITYSLHTSNNLVQLTISLYMLGFSISPLFYGYISDRIGRRNPLLFGIVFCIIGTFFCIVAPSVYLLIFGRLLQGIGTGACISISRAITRDIFSGTNLAKIASYLAICSVAIMAFAPTMGGYIQAYFGWRSNFIFLLVYSFLLLAVIFYKLPETNQYIGSDFKKNKIIINYINLLHNKTFIGYSLCTCFSYAGIIAYITIGPFILQNLVGISPIEFGWLAVINSGAYILGGFINTRFVIKYPISKMITIGSILMLLAGLFMLIFAVIGYLNVWVIMVPVAIFMLSTGFIFANAFAGALSPFPQRAGTAGALAGTIQLLGGAAISALLALIAENSQTPLAITFIILGIITALSLKFLALADSKELTQ